MLRLVFFSLVVSLLQLIIGGGCNDSKFDIDVDSAVQWSTKILRSRGNFFPGGPTLYARQTSLTALVIISSMYRF